jgi:hypothetical protein
MQNLLSQPSRKISDLLSISSKDEDPKMFSLVFKDKELEKKTIVYEAKTDKERSASTLFNILNEADKIVRKLRYLLESPMISIDKDIEAV